MKTVKSSPFLLALLVCCLSLGPAVMRADELPKDTNAIKSLTPEQAKKLAAEFPGVTVEVEIKGSGKDTFQNALPLDGLESLDAETAKALAGYGRGPLVLNGLTTLSPEAAKALAGCPKWNGDLSGVTAFDSPDSVAIAKALATRKDPLKLPNLKKISPKTLTALIDKNDVEIPLIETLELIQEPDGSATDDFIIPEGFQERQKQRSR